MAYDVKIHVLPGGRHPERQTDGAVGYDVFLRALVCPYEMDKQNSHLRKTLFDFQNKCLDANMAPHVAEESGQLVYRLEPGGSVLGCIGFLTEMPSNLFYWVLARSGLASKHRITLGNAPGTVDSDYRGAAGVVIVNQGRESFSLFSGMRIAQIAFQEVISPNFIQVPDYRKLSKTRRGEGGFGSTGGFTTTRL